MITRSTAPTGRDAMHDHAILPLSGQDTSMTCRRSYVPQLAHAVCGSLGSRHCGQATRVGTVVFHCERRCRVLLRDFFRFGTATSALLAFFS
jgi:hypothetical protein